MAKAAVTRSIRDDHQKNFLKIFNGLTGKHSRWEIWEDFVTLTAIEISNSTDKVNATERTKMYQTIISKYSAKERDGMAEMLAEVVMGMEQNPDQDFLGSLYMMCELGNDHAGQFFTPCDVCRCMAEITFDPKLHPDMEGFISVSDPACGAGATLLAFLNVCKRRNMDEREQLQTMMIENMQRSDLTTYEQAQGFQLMLDLGDTVEQVASKSGFSQSTIRRRVKLLSLDRDAFRRAELRGATLSDYAELDKIESVEDKNKALEALGTQNFRRVMQEVLKNQKWEHRKAEWIADLKKFAIEDPNATYQTHEHVTGYSKWNITKDVVVPEDADHVQYFYKVSSGQIDLYKTRDVAAEDAEKAKRDAAREEERMIGESFHNITELMFNLRREFVVELAPTDCKKGFPAIARYMACAADDNFDLDLTLIGNILGVELSQEFVDSSGKDWYKILDEDGVYGAMPEKVLLALAYSSMDSSYCGYWSKDWNVERQKYVYSYRENPTLDATYEMLTALGYEISDDEQALRDGTHKIFREYGSDEKKWSDCDYCKAAHPNCDKCCKACDEPCNAAQACKKNEERTENNE